jgi:hypothetical protein
MSQAEMGADMSVFGQAHCLPSWVGMCPSTNGSPSRHKSGRTRKGTAWVRGRPCEFPQRNKQASSGSSTSKFTSFNQNRLFFYSNIKQKFFRFGFCQVLRAISSLFAMRGCKFPV